MLLKKQCDATDDFNSDSCTSGWAYRCVAQELNQQLEEKAARNYK